MCHTVETAIDGYRIRTATSDDTALILDFIRKLAAYERLLSEVVATEAVLHESLFVKKQAEVIIGEHEGRPVAFALYTQNFSTFLGKGNLYLEDLYVDEHVRGRGFGKAMLICLAKIAVSRGCERLDWCCLNWNEPSIAFYKQLGAVPMSDWTTFRLAGKALVDVSKGLCAANA